MNRNILNIIAIINYEKNNYCIYQVNKNVGYLRLNNGHFDVNLDTKVIDVLRKFYNLIRYNKDYSVYCGNYIINNNDYEIFLDTRSNLYTFVLDKNNKRYTPTKEDMVLLNTYFNDEKLILYDKEKQDESQINYTTEKKKLPKFIKKVLKVGGATAIALISAGIITYNLPQDVKSNLDYELGVKFRNDYTLKDKSYTFEDIEKAIEENIYISDADKDFIKEVFEAEFEENKEYMDISYIIERLKDFKIQYDKYYTYNNITGKYNLTHEDDKRWDVVASYNVSNNTMTCIEKKYSESEIENKINDPFGFNEVVKSVYYHEVNHLFTRFSIDSSLSDISEGMASLEANGYVKTNLGIFENISDDMQKNFNTSFFRETINEIFSQEYVEKYYQRTKDENRVVGYSESISYMYCLSEILPENVLREYKFNDNDSIITDGLLSISNNKDEAFKLMTSLKSINLYQSLVNRVEANENKEQSNLDLDKAYNEQAQNYKKIHDGLNYFYKAKYNRDISSDLNMLIYLYDTPVLTNEERQKVNQFLNVSQKNPEVQYQAKGYFSKEFKVNNPNVIAIYIDNEENVQSLEIIDSKNWERNISDNINYER